MKAVPNTFRVILLSMCMIFSIHVTLKSQIVKPIPSLVHSIEKSKRITRLFKIDNNTQIFLPDVEKTVAKKTIATLDMTALQNVISENATAMSLIIPFEGKELQLDLVQAPNVTEDFMVKTSTSKGSTVPYEKGKFYRGIINGDDESLVAISFFKNEIIGMVSSKENRNIVIGRVEKTVQPNIYIIYSDKDLIAEHTFKCESDKVAVSQSTSNAVEASAANVGGCVRVYYELDYGTFLNRGSRTNAVNYITACFNNVSTLYQNESISTSLSEVFVWETQDSYPTGGGSAALNAIKTARPTFNGDLAHLVSLRTSSSFSGIAWLLNGSPYTVLCSEYKYAYSQTAASFNTVPTYSWTIEVLTHEMGHNMGSPHTQSCSWPGGAIDGCVAVEDGTCTRPPLPAANSGTIMSYCHQVSSVGINFSLGFGTLPGDRIRQAIQLVNCLNSACTASTCTAPNTPSVSAITANSATVSWTAVSGAQSYRVEYKTSAASTWSSVNTTTNSISLTGLSAATAYNVRVYTVCSSSSSSVASTTANFNTLALTCTAPTTPSVSSITSNSATVSWTAVSGAQSYRVEYKTSAASTWSSVNATTNSISLTGLSAATAYNVRVYTVCSSSSSSVASTTANFNTLALTCTAPTTPSVSSITSNGATISWTAVSGAQSYRVEYKTSAASTWSSVNATTNSIGLTGLSAASAYSVRIYTVCSSSLSSGASTIANFSTLSATCAAPSLPSVSNITSNSATVSWTAVSGAQNYRVEYKTSAAATWSSVNSTTNSVNLTGLSAASAYSVRIYTVCSSSLSSSASTIANFSTLSAASCAVPSTLSVSSITSNSATISWAAVSGAQSYRVEYKTSAATVWTSITASTNSANLTGLSVATAYNVRVYTVCSSSLSSVASSIANFSTLSATCTAPNTPSASNITTNSALINWAAVSGAQSYTIEYKISSASSWTSLSSNTNSVSLTGLTAATAYNVRVYTVCSSSSSSVASGIANFNTIAPTCTAPGTPSASSVTVNSATISWNAVSGAQSYTVEYKISSASTWTIVSTTTNSINLSGLNASTSYDVRVYTVCSSSSSSIASGITNFTTLANVCTAPNTPSVTNVTVSSATVGWNAVSGAQSYRIEYKTAASSSWTSLTSTTNSINLTGLISATPYNVQVFTICTSNLSSSASSIANFTTLSTSGCVDNYEPNNSLTTAKVISLNEATYGMISSVSDYDYFKFTTTSGAPKIRVSLTNLPANYDMTVFRLVGTSLLQSVGSSVNTGTKDEVIIYNTPTVAATYIVYISGTGGASSSSACYRLFVTTGNVNFSSIGSSPISEVQNENIKLKLSPNPTSDLVNINLNIPQSGEFKLSITDLIGRTMYTENLELIDGETQVIVSTDKLPIGMYIVKLQNDTYQATSKLMIQR